MTYEQVLVVGPSPTGLKGGQVTHMENIEVLFTPEVVRFFYSSSGKEGTENLILKFFRLIFNWGRFPFNLMSVKVVHLNTSFDAKACIRDLILCFIAILFRKKIIIQYHGGSPIGFRLINSSSFKFLFQFCYVRSNILVLTEEQYDWIKDKKPLSIKKVLNYVSLPPKQKLINKKPVFLYVGRIIKEKGLVEILEAASNNSDKNFTIRICGSGEDAEYLVDEIKKRSLQELVTFVGSVSGNDKADEFRNCDVFLYPSYYPEGLPYSVIEALSYQCAVACTDAGALKHLLDNETSVKVGMRDVRSLSNAISLLIKDFEFRKKIATNGRVLVEKKMSLNSLKETLESVWFEA